MTLLDKNLLSRSFDYKLSLPSGNQGLAGKGTKGEGRGSRKRGRSSRKRGRRRSSKRGVVGKEQK